MPTARQIRLLHLLEQEENYQPGIYFADSLGVSKRTLQAELKALREAGVVIKSQRGVGILLDKGRSYDLEPLKETSELLGRRFAIMGDLLFSQEMTSFNILAEKYFISKSSIKQDLLEIEQLLSRGSKIKLISDNEGTRLEGDARAWIDALTIFNQIIMGENDFLNYSVEEKMGIMDLYYPQEMLAVCQSVFYSHLKRHVGTFQEIYVENFLCVLIALVWQLMHDYHLPMSRRLLDIKEHAFFIDSAEEMLKRSAARLHFDYSSSDVAFLSKKLVQFRIEPLPDSHTDETVALSLITKVASVLNIDITKDATLLAQIKQHIPAMLYRLRARIRIKNPFTQQIKREYAILFNSLWLVLSDFGHEIGVAFNDEEIAYLTIYFQLALEKIGVSRNILVVCQAGIVTSEFLVNRIEQILPSFDSVEVASVLEIEDLDLDHYDLILSTIHIDIEQPFHYISPFMKDEVLSKLLTKPKSTIKQTQSTQILAKYLKPELVFLDEVFSKREKLLQNIAKRLETMGLVTQGFAKSIIEREALGNTDMASGVAFPHGRVEEVKRSFVALIRNQNKFKWGDYYVDIIFLIGINRRDIQDTKALIADIYEIIDNSELLTALRKEDSRMEVMKILHGR